MKWQSLEHFLSMGGRGLYVWGSYAVAVAVVTIEVILLRARTRAARKLAGAPRPGGEAD
jgi:heme exporter protein D